MRGEGVGCVGCVGWVCVWGVWVCGVCGCVAWLGAENEQAALTFVCVFSDLFLPPPLHSTRGVVAGVRMCGAPTPAQGYYVMD